MSADTHTATVLAQLAQLAEEPLLSAAEEVALARAAEVGALASERLEQLHDLSGADTGPRAAGEAADLAELVAAGQASFDRLVRANTRLVFWAAGRRLRSGDRRLERDDLVAEGMAGLIRAAHKFDYTRGMKFSTYAVNWIVSFQGRACLRATGVPPGMWEQRNHIRRTRDALTQSLGRSPTGEELAAEVGLNPARIAEIEASVPAVTRLDAPLRGNVPGRASTRHDLIAQPATDGEDLASPGPVDDAVAERVSDLLDVLPARQQQLLRWRFGLEGHPPLRVADIAARCRVSRRRVERSIEMAMETLRREGRARGGQ